MVDPTYVEGEQVAIAGANIRFVHTIQRDGAALNLSGAVTATVRASWLGAVLDPDLEDMTVAVVDADEGEVDWTIPAEVSALLAPYCPANHVDTAAFDLQYHVPADDYFPQVFRFHVRSVAD